MGWKDLDPNVQHPSERALERTRMGAVPREDWGMSGKPRVAPQDILDVENPWVHAPRAWSPENFRRQSPVGHTSGNAPTAKAPMSQRLMENALLGVNQDRMAGLGGGPVKKQNKMAKSDFMAGQSGRMDAPYELDVADGRGWFNRQPQHPVGDRFLKPNQAPWDQTPVPVGRNQRPNVARLAGPMGKLPGVLALPGMLGSAGETIRDAQDPNMGWKEQMIRFLGRSGGLDTRDPNMI